MFVIILRYLVSMEKIDEYRPQHLAFLDNYYAKKIFVASGRQVPASGGVIIAKANSRSKILEIIKEDPFYIKNLAEFTIYEFEPNKFSPEFSKILI